MGQVGKSKSKSKEPLLLLDVMMLLDVLHMLRLAEAADDNELGLLGNFFLMAPSNDSNEALSLAFPGRFEVAKFSVESLRLLVDRKSTFGLPRCPSLGSIFLTADDDAIDIESSLGKSTE